MVCASYDEKITGSGSPSSMEHILYVMSAMNPSYGLNYSMYYWNHGLQREVGIEAVCECFNGCEWECV